MPRILVRSGKDPRSIVSPEASLAQNLLGTNAGNMLFAETVHRMLGVPGAEVVSSSYLTERQGVDEAYADRLDDEFDAFVLPLANAFRTSFLPHLDRLSGVIERLTIPVTVVGVGAQADVHGNSFDLPEGATESVTRFMRAVLDHSASVGVRGEVTRSYLRGLGFGDEHTHVIGCPSLFRNGPDLRVVKKVEQITPESAISINVTPSVAAMGGISAYHAEKYSRMTFVAQENPVLSLLLWAEDPANLPDPDLPIHSRHRLYLEDRIRLFVDPTTWLRFMATQDFAFGTRIHGNVAALLAGTPAMLLAHDSRVLELADYHSIPRRMISSVGSDVDAEELYTGADFTSFNRDQPERFAEFCRFLEHNALEHIYQQGKANPDFDRQLEGIDFPPGVGSLMASGVTGRQAIANRLRWLRQGPTEDRARNGLRHPAAFPCTPPAEKPVVSPEAFSQLRTRSEAQSGKLAEVEQLVTDLMRILAEQSALLVEQRNRVRLVHEEVARLQDELSRQRTELEHQGTVVGTQARAIKRHQGEVDGI